MYDDMTTEELFALCIWREASGEGYVGMLCVAWVIWNRHLRWRADTRQIILGPNQFTSMTVDRNPRNPDPNDYQMNQAHAIVSQVMASAVPDPTNGACYYYNPTTANSPWFVRHIVENPSEHPQTAKVGQHVFYA